MVECLVLIVDRKDINLKTDDGIPKSQVLDPIFSALSATIGYLLH